MKCITHDEVDAVATCSSCGVGICKACEENTNFRIDNKALCVRCNYETLNDQIRISKRFIRISVFKGIIYSTLLIWGIVSFVGKYNVMNSSPDTTLTMVDCVLSMLLFWGLASIGNFFKSRPNNSSVQSQVSDALFEFRYPGTSLIAKAIGFIITFLISAVLLPFKILLLIFNIRKEVKVKNHNQSIFTDFAA